MICGGLNSKSPLAGAVWRQGHLLHFGSEQSPAEMNERGRALLVNAICYISRFTEDRPIVRSPSSFYEQAGVGPRCPRPTDQESRRDLTQYLRGTRPPSARRFEAEPRRLRAPAEGQSGFLVADEKGHYVIDAEARKFGVPPDSEGFIPRAMEAWKKPGSGESSLRNYSDGTFPKGPRREQPQTNGETGGRRTAHTYSSVIQAAIAGTSILWRRNGRPRAVNCVARNERLVGRLRRQQVDGQGIGVKGITCQRGCSTSWQRRVADVRPRKTPRRGVGCALWSATFRSAQAPARAVRRA